MSIQNKIQFLALDSIAIDRKARQRSVLLPENVLDLAVSIGTNQWVSPLLVDESMTIIAGERRHTAVGLLQRASKGDFSAFPDPAAAKLRLLPVCKCKSDSYENWTRVPCQLGKSLTDEDKLTFELIENLHREDLSWQDKARACHDLHSRFLKKSEKKWTLADTATAIGISIATVSTYLNAWREHEAGDEKAKAIVKGSTSLKKATLAIERVRSRKDGELSLDAPKPKTQEPAPDADTPTAPIENASFIEWARSYEGPAFNFIHCDFPYGIDYNAGRGQSTGVDTQMLGAYDDSPDVYWELLNALLESRDQLCADSCHIMFWFSMHHYCGTLQRIEAFWPDATIQPFPMIWHCSDNSGLVPDAQRYGRRTYETALLITLGDRKIVSPKALSFAAPRNQTKIHRSQKHLDVLSHFFSMFVDDSTRMLDPTCGSGTALIAAKRLGARSVLGLEVDKEMAEAATKFYSEQVKA